MKIKRGQLYKNKNGVPMKVVNPNCKDENGEPYFTYNLFDKHANKFLK